MTTFRPADNTYRRNRSIKARWTGPEITEQGETLTQVIEFAVYHHKDRKAFTASLTPLKVGQHFERWQSDDAGVRVAAKSVARYSDKALQAFFDEAFATLVAAAEIPQVAELLARADITE